MNTEILKKLSVIKNQDDIYAIEGVATAYDIIDKQDELIKSGAFDGSIGRVIPIMIGHKGTGSTIGTAKLIKEGKKVLIKGQLFEHSKEAQSIALAKKEGVIYNLSIGGAREIYKFKEMEDKTILVTEKGEITEISIIERNKQAHQDAIITKNNTKNQHNKKEDLPMEKLQILKALEITEEQFNEITKADDLDRDQLIEKLELKKEDLDLIKKLETFNKSFEEVKKEGEENKKALENANEMLKNLQNLNTNNDTQQNAIIEKELSDFVRTGEKGKNLIKALTTDPSSGGVLLPVNKSNDILKCLREESPVYNMARIRTITKGNQLTIKMKVYNTSNNKSAVQAEGTNAGAESILKFAPLEIKVEKYTDKQEVTQEMIDDSINNAFSEIAEDASENLATNISQNIWKGTGAVEGINLNTELQASATITKTVGAIDADSVLDLCYKVTPRERAKGSYYASTDAIAKLRKLKDSTGAFLFTPSLVTGTPAKFNGYPLYEDVYMDIVAAGNFPICFANMKKLYQIVKRKDLTIERDRDADSDVYYVYTRMRIGAKVGQICSGALLKIKA